MTATAIERKLALGELTYKPTKWSPSGALKSPAEVVVKMSASGQAGELARFVTAAAGRKLHAKLSRTLDGPSAWEGTCYLGSLSVKPPRGTEEHATAAVPLHHMPLEAQTESIMRLVALRLEMDEEEEPEVYVRLALWQEELPTEEVA